MHIRAIPAKKKTDTAGRRSKTLTSKFPRGIQAFEEHSPVITKKGKSERTVLNAHELFNLFTADIIKDNTIFRR